MSFRFYSFEYVEKKLHILLGLRDVTLEPEAYGSKKKSADGATTALIDESMSQGKPSRFRGSMS